MFDIGWGEFVVIGAVALVVIGPKELPGVLRTVGGAVSKLRRMAGEFQTQFQEAIREADLEETRKSVDGLNQATFNPIQSIRDEIKNAVEGKPQERPYTGPIEAPPDYNFPPPPPVPDLTPEQIQQAFTTPETPATPAVEAPASEPAPEVVAAAEGEAVAEEPKPKRRARKPKAKTETTDEEGAA